MSTCKECGAKFKQTVKICESCGCEIKAVNRDYWDTDFKHLNLPYEYRPYEEVVKMKKRKSISRRIRH
jgi:uncharacterized protein YicC (UPF0701 family)